MIKLQINGKPRTFDVPGDMPLLWVLRGELGLNGTKYGCGMALCGACTVHLDGEAVRSCVTPLSAAAAKEVTTIEGLAGRECAGRRDQAGQRDAEHQPARGERRGLQESAARERGGGGGAVGGGGHGRAPQALRMSAAAVLIAALMRP